MKRSKIFPIAFIIVILTPFSRGFSQSGISTDSIKSMLITDWERAKAYTQDYLNAMPADKYSYRPTDSVRTFAQQMLHIAQANKFFVSIATGEKPAAGPDLEKSATAQSADSVKYYVNSSYDYTINAIRKLSISALMQPATFSMGQKMTEMRLRWFLKSFEHQTHHRGQTTVYLRLAGVRPPGERLF